MGTVTLSAADYFRIASISTAVVVIFLAAMSTPLTDVKLKPLMHGAVMVSKDGWVPIFLLPTRKPIWATNEPIRNSIVGGLNFHSRAMPRQDDNGLLTKPLRWCVVFFIWTSVHKAVWRAAESDSDTMGVDSSASYCSEPRLWQIDVYGALHLIETIQRGNVRAGMLVEIPKELD